MAEFSSGIFAVADLNRPAFADAGFHAAGIRAVNGYDVAAPQSDIGEKTFVPFNKVAGNKRWKKLHSLDR